MIRSIRRHTHSVRSLPSHSSLRLSRARRCRKGYFFVLDAFLAMSILVLGILIVYSFRSYSPSQVQPLLLADDVMESLSSNKVGDLAGNISGPGIYVQGLISDGDIPTMQNTLLEQIGEFYALDNDALCRSFTANITDMLIPSQYGFALYVNVTNHSLNTNDFKVIVNNISVQQDESSMLVTSKRIVAGIVNETVMWGPFIMEARIWL